MKPIRVIENYWSRLYCTVFNISGCCFYNYILLGCYKDRKKTLLHELQHFYQFRSIRWFPIKYLLQTIRNGYWNNKYEKQHFNLSYYLNNNRFV